MKKMYSFISHHFNKKKKDVFKSWRDKGKNNYNLNFFFQIFPKVQEQDIRGNTRHMLCLTSNTYFVCRQYKELKLPSNHMACLAVHWWA